MESWSDCAPGFGAAANLELGGDEPDRAQRGRDSSPPGFDETYFDVPLAGDNPRAA